MMNVLFSLKGWLLLIIFTCGFLSGNAQEKNGQIDLFCGAELNYNDTDILRLYNVLINLTPGVKWNMGNGWMTAGQLSYAAMNYGYDSRNNYLRIGMVTLSKELVLGSNQHLKFTSGLFGYERYGLDARWMMPVNSWLMLQARAGVTNQWWLSTDESVFEMKKWIATGVAGVNIWIDKWTTELRLSGGRYINEDYGMEGEVYCHFRHCSIGAFAQWHETYYQSLIKSNYNYSGGFRVVMLLPPYELPQKKVRIRPASNFRLTYNAQSDGYSMKMYHTDPEENEREYQTKVRWGTGLY